MLNQYKDTINNLAMTVSAKRALLTDKQESLAKATLKLQKHDKTIDIYTKVNEFLNQFSSSTREQISTKIETLVTSVLQKVFPNRYTFKIVFQTKRNVTEAVFYLYNVKHKQNETIMGSNGGGVADIVSTILFFAFLEINNQGKGYLIFDEIAKHLAAPNRAPFFTLLKEIKGTYQKQIIYVSHQNELLDVADKIIRLESGIDGFVKVIQ